LNAVELRDVSVTYRGHIALRGITLDIESGAHVAVIGPNGAGKTTLLTAVNGLGTIRGGSVRIFGAPLSPGNRRAVRQKTGYLAQDISIDPRSPFSVADIVMMGRTARARLFQRTSKEDVLMAGRAMDMCGIASLKERPIGYLSGGEKQKVFLARALAQEPDILLLDEPTASLDLKAQREIIRLIDRIYSEKKLTIIFVTHILWHIPSTCREACLLKEGRIQFMGPLADALDGERLTRLYDCPITKTMQLTF
jgi:ABC-type cobalamin/Fe3+-siderophores transport system ATPase subunit